MEMGIQCVTEDRELQGKFPNIAVSMDGFLKNPGINGVHERKAQYRRHKT
jgi:hypothetical protein